MIEPMDYAAVAALHTLPRTTSLAQAFDDSIQVFAEERTYPIPAPLFIDTCEPLSARTSEIAARTEGHNDPTYLARLNDVLLTGHRDLFTLDGLHLTDLCNQAGLHSRPPGLEPNESGGWKRSLGAMVPELVDETAGLLFFHAASGDNHSHWLLQTLPQLYLYERAGIRPQKLIVQPNIQPYQREMLRILGWKDSEILMRPIDRPVIFRELYAGYVDGAVVPEAAGVYDRLRDAVPRRPGGPEKLFISRQDARQVRRFLNEDRLIEAVQELGFTVVTPGKLGLQEEISLFRGARVITGALGAGLYNAVYADPGATVVGLSDPHYVMTWLPETASLRDHHLAWMFGVAFDSIEPGYAGTHNNWICDVGQVIARLRAL